MGLAQTTPKYDSTSTYIIHKSDDTHVIGNILESDEREIYIRTSDGRKFYLPQHLITKIELQTSTQYDATKVYTIRKTDGATIRGKILQSDMREILVETYSGRKFYIPQAMIEEISEANNADYDELGRYVGEDPFATRYFITTNGLPIKKGDNYIQWNLFGPDVQFGLSNDFGVGVMTTWWGDPLVFSAKKSWQSENAQFAIGGLFGIGTWITGFRGVLPFATVSLGDRRSNIAFSGGYGAVDWGWGEFEGNALASVAFMSKVSPSVSFVFDSFFILPNEGGTTVGLIMPGLRFHQKREERSFQFGFTGLLVDDYWVPVPIPTLQWYQAF